MAVTTVYGVLGSPIAHSLSPVMHNAAFAALDL
ncbi:MAG: shikimate dehydrogenase, partial [Halobacteriota archaeon]